MEMRDDLERKIQKGDATDLMKIIKILGTKDIKPD